MSSGLISKATRQLLFSRRFSPLSNTITVTFVHSKPISRTPTEEEAHFPLPRHSCSLPLQWRHFGRLELFPISLSLLLVLTLWLSSLTTIYGAMNKTQMIQQFLDGHNNARKAVGVPLVTWEPLLATYARVYSNQRRHDCRLVHSSALVFAENIFWGQGRRWTAKDAVDAWVAEKQYYNYKSNNCSGPDCSHYTQIVWRNTQRVGCAKIICDSGDNFITCEYYPPGNYIGDRPY